jgi:hypothetical protein
MRSLGLLQTRDDAMRDETRWRRSGRPEGDDWCHAAHAYRTESTAEQKLASKIAVAALLMETPTFLHSVIP